MHRRFWVAPLLVLWVLAAVGLARGEVVKPVDPGQYRTYRDLLHEMYDMQDPFFAREGLEKWSPQNTRRMGQILEELDGMKAKGFVLPKNDALLKIENRLVENMHVHCMVLSTATYPNAVLLRVGKTPDHPEFGGLLAAKVSDFDMTVVGRDAARARDLHLNLMKKMYGERFVQMTMTDLALADGTIAAWQLPQIRAAFGTAVLNPELHRTYSGLQFVEDYILEVGEISVPTSDGRLVTMRLDKFPGPDKKQQFIEWANEAFKKSGQDIRFGQRQADFCFGLATDISNQMWMNVQKEANKAQPHLVVKKYVERYASEVKTRMDIDLRQPTPYGDLFSEIETLIGKCEAGESDAWEALQKKVRDFEGHARGTIAQKQAAMYADAMAAGKLERAAAILLDTEGAIQNLVLAEQKIPTGALGKLGETAAKNVADNPLFVEAKTWRQWMRTAVWDELSMKQFAKSGASAFLKVGPSLFSIYSAYEQEAEGDRGAVQRTITEEAREAFMFQGLPYVLDSMGYKSFAQALGPVGFAWGMVDCGFTAYQAWVAHLTQTMFVEPAINARLAGVKPDGNPIGVADVLTTMGFPMTQEELDAPANYPTGEYEMGRLVIERDANGDIAFKQISEEFERGITEAIKQRQGQTNFDHVPEVAWKRWTLTRGQIVADKRLARAYETLRREYVKQHPQPAGDKVAEIDPRGLREPFHLRQPLRFAYPVHREEIFFYWHKYNEAALKAGVEFKDATSVWREAGHDAEKDLAESSIRAFLEAMAKFAAHDDRAKNFYLNADAMTLEAHLQAGAKAHFDGRDITPEEIKARIASLREAALRDAEARSPQWTAWMKEHWKAEEFPDAGDGELVVLSTTAAPEGPMGYRIVCRYRLSKYLPLEIKLYDKASDTMYHSHPTYMDPENDKDLTSPGAHTCVMHTSRRDDGTDQAYFIRFLGEGDKTVGQSSDIVVPGYCAAWVFEKVARVNGPAESAPPKNDERFVDSFKTEIDGASVRVQAHSASETRFNDASRNGWSWADRAIWIGPLPESMPHDKEVGFWVEELKTRKEFDGSAPGYPAVEVKFESGKTDADAMIDVEYSARDSDADEQAKDLKLPPVKSRAAGEGDDYTKSLYVMEPHCSTDDPDRMKIVMAVKVKGVEEPIRFEWTYRKSSGPAIADAQATAPKD